uniref:Uncharacterized protein LOC114337250 n=1 Tax=Diabrotica virgifera virgifera TaxID=50390 RepID=A0A6P7GER8_DIAVI
MKTQGQMCKTKWANIKDTFRHYLHIRKCGKVTKRYKRADQLSFLKKHFNERETITNIKMIDNSQEESEKIVPEYEQYLHITKNGKVTKMYKYADQLRFLTKHFNERGTITNIKDIDNTQQKSEKIVPEYEKYLHTTKSGKVTKGYKFNQLRFLKKHFNEKETITTIKDIGNTQQKSENIVPEYEKYLHITKSGKVTKRYKYDQLRFLKKHFNEKETITTIKDIGNTQQKSENIVPEYEKYLHITKSGKVTKRYKYDQLRFLKKHFNERRTITNIKDIDNTQRKSEKIVPEDEESNSGYKKEYNVTASSQEINDEQNEIIEETNSQREDSSASIQGTEKLPIQKHTAMDSLINKREEQVMTPPDTVDAFLTVITPALKSLSPLNVHFAKSEIFSVVQKYELKCLQEQTYTNFNQQQSRAPTALPIVSPASSYQYTVTLLATI